MIELHLLGTIDLRTAQGREISAVLAQPKRLALLIYLDAARPRGFHRRDTLVALFWPELDTSHSRNALSKVIHHLRRSLGDGAVQTRGDEVLLDHLIVSSDVRELDDALAARNHAKVLELYRGPLADGFFVDDAPGFERWLESERERLRSAASSSAWILADQARESRRVSEAAMLARKAASLVPDDEPTLRRLMDFLDSIGDRTGALKAYEQFTVWLGREFDAVPASDTQALHLRIRNAVAPESAVVVRNSPMAAADSVPVVPRRTLTPLRIATIVAALTASLLFAIGLAGSASSKSVYDAKRVMVSRFENRTGNPKYDPIGTMAMDWLSEDIAASGLVTVVDPRANALTSAGLVVTGSYYLAGSRLRFHAQLAASADGVISRAFVPVSAPLDSPTAAFDSVGIQAIGSIAEATDARVSAFSREGRRPPSYESYLEYVKGIDAFGRHDEDAAYKHFMRAYQTDTTFVTALLNAGASVLNRFSGSDSVMSMLIARRDALTPFNQAWFDSYVASRREDWSEVFRITGDLARQSPGSYFPYLHASASIAVNNPREALDALLSVDPQRGWMRDWFDYWYVRCAAQHMLGDYPAELRDAQLGRRQYPANFAVISAEVRALASMGKAREVDELLDVAATITTHHSWEVASPYAIAASEAAYHGHPVIAAEARSRLLSWYRSLPEEKLATEPRQFGPGWMLYLAGAWPELTERTERFMKISPEDPLWIIYAGAVAAHAGDRTRAMELDAEMQRITRDSAPPTRIPWLPPSLALYSRARIAALLGENDRAIALLQDAFAHRMRYTIYVHADPAFASLRDDPRWIRMMAPR